MPWSILLTGNSTQVFPKKNGSRGRILGAPGHAGERIRKATATLQNLEKKERPVDAQDRHELTLNERRAVKAILDRIVALARFLEESPIPEDLDSAVLYSYLARMKEIQGNTDNGVSLVACLMAKEYLNGHLDMEPFDVAAKAQGAAGLDIDARTRAGARVVAEIKTTMPYGADDLGSAQKTAFEKDFRKLNAAAAGRRFLFLTERRTFELMRLRYASRIPGVKVVLLPSGESIVA